MARPRLQAETTIRTVQTANVDNELGLAFTFGWTLQGSSARSYPTSGVVVGTGYAPSRFGVGAAGVVMRNEHQTDLHLERVLDGKGLKLRELEQQFDGVNFWNWKGLHLYIGSLVVIGLLATYVLGGQLNQYDAAIKGIILTPFLACIPAGLLMFWKSRHNKGQHAQRDALLEQARKVK